MNPQTKVLIDSLVRDYDNLTDRDWELVEAGYNFTKDGKSPVNFKTSNGDYTDYDMGGLK